MRAWRAIVLAAVLAACGPNLGELEAGEEGRVEAAFNGDNLALNSGLRVFLAEIDAPRGEAAYARQAQQELEALALQREVRLAYGGTKRWTPARAAQNNEAPQETALAHVFVKSEGGRWFWLQHELVARGAAWVRPRSDNHAREAALLAVEADARAGGRGLWAERTYRTLSPRDAAAEARTLSAPCQNSAAPFRFVEGVIGEVEEQRRRAVLRFTSNNPETSFALVIFGRNHENWRGPAFGAYRGARVRARGALESFRFRDAAPGEPGRAQMCIEDAGQIEILREPEKPR